jgi:hypothetical protein
LWLKRLIDSVRCVFCASISAASLKAICCPNKIAALNLARDVDAEFVGSAVRAFFAGS